MTSVVAIATIPVADASVTLMLSPTTRNNDVTGTDDVFVLLNLNRDTAAAASADHLISTVGIQKAALVYDISNRS